MEIALQHMLRNYRKQNKELGLDFRMALQRDGCVEVSSSDSDLVK